MEEDTANDEELARALSEQFQAEEAALRASSRQNIPVVIGTVENEPYLHQPSSTINSQFMEDELRLSEAFANSSPEEIARRLAQEEEDAALAARLAQQDINFATGGTTAHQVPTNEADMQRRRTARRKQSMRSALTCILGKQLLILCVYIYGMVWYRFDSSCDRFTFHTITTKTLTLFPFLFVCV